MIILIIKLNVKVPALKIFWILKSLLTSDINLSQGFPHFCVRIYFPKEKLTEIYQVKSK